MLPSRLLWLAPFIALPCCTPARSGPSPAPSPPPVAEPAPYPSSYVPLPSRTTLIRNATVLSAAGAALERGSVLIRDGRIAAVGTSLTPPADATVIDATGKWVTPGLIDPHSHIGVGPAPGVRAVADINEATNPNTAEVWAEHSVWPQDPQFALALAGGVTTALLLPGSANLFGGRTVTVKLVPARTVAEMKFPGAPYELKMACGENPKRVYQSRGPSTRMGNMAGFRQAFVRAQRYQREWQRWRSDGADPAKQPARDLQLETLAEVLDGRMPAQIHCYGAHEMAMMLDLSREFDFPIGAFIHAVEAYKIRDLLRASGVCSLAWSDWWGFKLEAYDGIMANMALLEDAGACVALHSDDAQGIQRLNQDAAKAMAAGWRAGIEISREAAIRWITINAAKAMGIADSTGSLEPGKMADVVIWDRDPFSVYARAERVFIDGALVFDRNDPRRQPRSDFILGILPQEVTR